MFLNLIYINTDYFKTLNISKEIQSGTDIIIS